MLDPPESESSIVPVHNGRGKSSELSLESQNSDTSINGQGQVLCTHDGILLKKATAEFITDINNSGSLNLVEYTTPHKHLTIEWRPDENIFIEADDDSQWALIDTISKRERTLSESKVFNSKLENTNVKIRCFRTDIEELRSIEVLSRGQKIRFIRLDGTIQSEYFFQNGNAENFVKTLQHLHILTPSQHNKREYIVLNLEAQKLKKTFAELKIDDIKNAQPGSGGWFQNKLVDFLVKVPDYVAPQPLTRNVRVIPKPDEYEVLDEDNSSNTKSNDQEITEFNDKTPKVERVLPERKMIERGSPLTEKQWREFQTEDGRISDPTRIKEAIFRGGVDKNIRCEVWKYLLNYYDWDDTTVAKVSRKEKKRKEYYQMKAQWLSISVTQEKNFTGYRDRKCQIEKDVKRTDRTQEFFSGEKNPNIGLLQDILMTYVMYNFDLGYVQGMSDLLAPILSIQQNEVDAFWCFVGFMDLVYSNFDVDQAGMKKQLSNLNTLLQFCDEELFEYLKEHGSDNMYFCFRWLLVWYKREFSNDDILELWECLWTRLPCPNFHLLVGIAILDQQKNTIIGNEYEFNEILKCINELSMKISLKPTLKLAEAIYGQIKESKDLTNEIRVIIGEDIVPVDCNLEDDCDGGDSKEQEFDDSFGQFDVRELSPEEERTRQEKFEEACDQSMYLSFL
ncbi:TBC1 domain family member 15 [Condylostylus longicornis]|uniref:TBC1 domain family member 15 n=1 Tax=Condylostylus longicornis TaxID=2530218 RepID=UPI00244E3B61|nr:TBC1 domain family member 15 [Condylostylus longicornis]